MKLQKILVLILLITILLTGCAETAESVPHYAPSDANQLTIYTSHKEEVYLPIIREFESRTGIWVRVVTGGTNELLEWISSESTAPMADVMFGGGVENLESYRDCFCPYVCAEDTAIKEQFKSEDHIWTPFSALPVVLIYNTKLVNPSDLTDWKDLTNPAFQGRIAFADPTISGSSFTAMLTYYYASDKEVGVAVAMLAEALQGSVLGSSGEVLTTVADGTNLVGITLEETALKYMAAGEDIAVVYPGDGTSCVPDGIALVNNAPHMDNARLFMDFVVSYDVQQMLPNSFFRRAIRSDIPEGETLLPLQDITLIEYDIIWVCQNRDAILSDWTKLREEMLR